MWGWGQKFQLYNHRIGSAGNWSPFFIGFQKALFNIIKDTLLALWKKDSKSEVAQSCPTLWDPMDCSLYQAPPSMGFSRWEYWSGLPFPPPGDLPNPGIEPGSPALQADNYPLSHQEALPFTLRQFQGFWDCDLGTKDKTRYRFIIINHNITLIDWIEELMTLDVNLSLEPTLTLGPKEPHFGGPAISTKVLEHLDY